MLAAGEKRREHPPFLTSAIGQNRSFFWFGEFHKHFSPTPIMVKQKAKVLKQKKNSVSEYFFCLFFSVALLILGILGILEGTVTVSTNRHVPGTPLYGEEAMTVAVGFISCASLLILWLCRHRSWLPLAIGVALIGNVIVATLVFSEGQLG